MVIRHSFGKSVLCLLYTHLTDTFEEVKIEISLVFRADEMQAEEISRLIGKSTGITIYEVEKGAIRRFADAVGDFNPLYRNEDAALRSVHGSIIAPPGFFGWPVNKAAESALMVDIPSELICALEKEGYPLASALDGKIEYEYFSSIKAGDILASFSTVKSTRERAKMFFLKMETVYLNQYGNMVAIVQAQYILRNLISSPVAARETYNA